VRYFEFCPSFRGEWQCASADHDRISHPSGCAGARMACLRGLDSCARPSGPAGVGRPCSLQMGMRTLTGARFMLECCKAPFLDSSYLSIGNVSSYYEKLVLEFEKGNLSQTFFLSESDFDCGRFSVCLFSARTQWRRVRDSRLPSPRRQRVRTPLRSCPRPQMRVRPADRRIPVASQARNHQRTGTDPNNLLAGRRAAPGATPCSRRATTTTTR